LLVFLKKDSLYIHFAVADDVVFVDGDDLETLPMMKAVVSLNHA